MSQTPEVPLGSGDSIKVGTTGTIGSLMSQELESMKNLTQTSSSSQKKNTTSLVSVPFVQIPKRTQLKKNSSNESSSRKNCNSDPINLGNAQKTKPIPLNNGQLAPIPSNEANTDKITSIKKPSKKGHTYIVEVVDIKCSNPRSSRLKKLGFSKLSESIG